MNKIDTISELRDQVAIEGDVIILLGYYERGDKPILAYYFKEGNFIDDGGSIIVSMAPSINGAWMAIFNDAVFIEDFGVSETNLNNSECVLNAIKINKKLISKENKKYLVNSTINISETNINLSLGENTVFYSIPITSFGIEATKIFNISNAEHVKLKGIFDGGYIIDGVPQGIPMAADSSSSLIQIDNCISVKIIIQIQNFASNWSTSTIETLLNYGAVYIRGCSIVRCLNSQLTTSRIEGFVFLGNDHVIVDNFNSQNNVSIWTPLHCFCNNIVDILNCKIVQTSTANGSTINSYNNFTSLNNNFIHGGVGIDFSWESSIDISSFNITPVKVIIKNNIIKNCSRILTSMHHVNEVKKVYIGVFENYFENTERNITQSMGIIRVDTCEKLDIYFNVAKTDFESQGFFQSVGDLNNVNVCNNMVSSDFFLRLTQSEENKYGIINIKDNVFNALPLNGRSESNTNAFSSFAYVNLVSQSVDKLLLSNNTINAEGRVIWLQNINKICLVENLIKSSHKISYLISNIDYCVMYKNESFNCDIFSILANLNNSVMDIQENVEHSDISKSKGMFNTISGSLKSFSFIKNKFNVPNPNTYGIINNVNEVTDVLGKYVWDNTPEVSQAKILFSSTKFGNTLNRPTNMVSNYEGYYDTETNKYIFWDGTNWRDSMGNFS